jgi:biopolymer transport protein ExbD
VRLRHSRQEEPDLNLTPLIDVVFLLLIFFMVSTTFNKEAELNIELPEASAEKKKELQQPIEITINAQGQYYVNKKEVIKTNLDYLMRAIDKEAGGRKDPPIIISADAKTPHQAVITAMDAARQLGFVHLTFATKKTADQTE